MIHDLTLNNQRFLSFVPPHFAIEDENYLREQKIFYCVDHLTDDEIAQLVSDIKSLLEDDDALKDFSPSTLNTEKYSSLFVDMFSKPLQLTTFRQQEDLINQYISVDYPTHQIIDIEGFSGAGKTTLISQLLGFPAEKCILATATGKTSVGTRQFIVSDVEHYRIATTCIDYLQLEAYINDILRQSARSILKYRIHKEREDMFEQFFIDPKQQFRMRYLLGSLKEEEDTDGFINEELSLLFTLHEQQVLNLFSNYPHELKSEYEYLKPQEQASFEKEFVKFYYNSTEFLETKFRLLHLIKSHVENLLNMYNLQYEKDENDWVKTIYIETDSKKQCIDIIQAMSSNELELYGKLLTPIIQNFRAVGRFYPSWLDEAAHSKYHYIFNDNMGLDHVLQKKQFSLNEAMEKKIEQADKIILVNKGINNPDQRFNLLLEHLILTGQIEKLVLCHTHMDEFKGGELKKKSAQQKHVRRNWQQVIELLDEAQRPVIEPMLEYASFYLSNLDKEYEENEDLNTLIQFFSTESHTLQLNTNIQFDEQSFINEFTKYAKEYQNYWDTRYLNQSWQTIKALNRRYAELNTFEHNGLNPLNDFKKTLYSIFYYSFSQSLEHNQLDPDEKNQLQQNFSKLCIQNINQISMQRVVASKKKVWQDAYNLNGPKSTFVRKDELRKLALDIFPIAQMLDILGNRDENGVKFYDDLKSIVNSALQEIKQQQPDLSLMIRHAELPEIHVIQK